MAGHLAVLLQHRGITGFHGPFSQGKAQGMADLVGSSMSNPVPCLDPLHSQLPHTRRSLSHHIPCHIAGTMGCPEDSAPFAGCQCHAAEQSLLPHPSSAPRALGGLCPAPGCPIGGHSSLGSSWKLLGRNGGAYKEMGSTSPLRFTDGLGHGCDSHTPHICFRARVRLIQTKK